MLSNKNVLCCTFAFLPFQKVPPELLPCFFHLCLFLNDCLWSSVKRISSCACRRKPELVKSCFSFMAVSLSNYEMSTDYTSREPWGHSQERQLESCIVFRYRAYCWHPLWCHQYSLRSVTVDLALHPLPAAREQFVALQNGGKINGLHLLHKSVCSEIPYWMRYF